MLSKLSTLLAVIATTALMDTAEAITIRLIQEEGEGEATVDDSACTNCVDPDNSDLTSQEIVDFLFTLTDSNEDGIVTKKEFKAAREDIKKATGSTGKELKEFFKAVDEVGGFDKKFTKDEAITVLEVVRTEEDCMDSDDDSEGEGSGDDGEGEGEATAN